MTNAEAAAHFASLPPNATAEMTRKNALECAVEILLDLMKQMTRENALEWAAEMLLEILYRAADVIENALAGGMLEENLRRMFVARRKNHEDLIAEDEYVAGRFIKDEERCPECGTFLDGEETCSLCEDTQSGENG